MTTRQRLLVHLLAAVVVATATLGAADDVAVLKDRATRLWQGRVTGDWNTVYDLMSKEEQAQVPKDRFVAFQSKGGVFRYTSATVGDVSIDADLAWIAVEFTVQASQYEGVPARNVKTWDLWRKQSDEWRPVAKGLLDQFPRRPPHARNGVEEQALAARVNAVWEARRAQDWKKVYTFLDPDFRQREPIETFLARRSQYVYLGHTLEWAEVTEDRGRVKVSYDYKFDDPSLSKMEPKRNTEFEEWVKIDGQWYRFMPPPPPQGSN
jgi:hypothetical protein